MPVVIIFIVAVMLVVAAFPMPFGYYNLIRIVATAAFFWLGTVAVELHPNLTHLAQ